MRYYLKHRGSGLNTSGFALQSGMDTSRLLGINEQPPPQVALHLGTLVNVRNRTLRDGTLTKEGGTLRETLKRSAGMTVLLNKVG